MERVSGGRIGGLTGSSGVATGGAAAGGGVGDWDMSAYFSGVTGADFLGFKDDLRADMQEIRSRVDRVGPLSVDSIGDWSQVLVELEEIWSRSAHMASYLGCVGAADARDDAIKRETSLAASARVELEKTLVAVQAELARSSGEVFGALCERPELQPVRYFLERLRQRGLESMDSALEELASDLGVDGISAWGRLYDQISGSLEFDLEYPEGDSRRVPVSLSRSLLEDPDPALRRAALVGANRAWASVADAAAASLNAIAGTRLSLQRRRGVDHFLDPPLFDAGISRPTLEAMWSAVLSRLEVPRDYLRHKASLLARPQLGFQDLLAPLPRRESQKISWPAAKRRVVDAFERGYPALAAFAVRAFEENWIDHSSRPGKRPGGFCSTSYRLGQSRIFLTFGGTPGDLATLAHELGHAWHGWLMRDMRPWARRYPMTLAETASTFAERLMIDASLEESEGDPAERAFLLDGLLQDAASYLLNILMRFRFERAFYEERRAGEVGVERLKSLMCEAQRETYGDTLDPEELDPWFWASKLHFYITSLGFYNFPYTFGYLFSQEIVARARQAGPDFLAEYEELLRRTGSDTVERVARQALGVELGDPAFWHASIDRVEADLERFRETAAGLGMDSLR